MLVPIQSDEDIELMLHWRNLPSVRKNMFTDQVISYEDHIFAYLSRFVQIYADLCRFWQICADLSRFNHQSDQNSGIAKDVQEFSRMFKTVQE